MDVSKVGQFSTRNIRNTRSVDETNNVRSLNQAINLNNLSDDELEICLCVKNCCTTREQLIIGFLINIDIFSINNNFSQSVKSKNNFRDELALLLLKYFRSNDTALKNKRLALMHTKSIQKFIGHDQVFQQLFNFTFDVFLFYINWNIDPCLTVCMIPCFLGKKHHLRADVIGFHPTLKYDPDVLVNDNSIVSIQQIYATSGLVILLSINGHKTYSSNGASLLNVLQSTYPSEFDKSDDSKENLSQPIRLNHIDPQVTGINHNQIIFNFTTRQSNKICFSITIHTAGSYQQDNNLTRCDAAKLLCLILENNNCRQTIIDVRFLKSFGHDMEIFNQHVKVMKFVSTFPGANINYIPLWFNSLAAGTGFFANFYSPDVGYLQIINTIMDFDLDEDSIFVSHIKYMQNLLKDLFTNKKFEVRGSSRLIFGLLVIIIAMMPDEQKPSLLCGCMSAKDRTMAFIFCALIISTVFFHRLLLNPSNEPSRLFSFIDNNGRLVRYSLSYEELDLIRAKLNNPILYNILSKLGIGEYNNKNLDIIAGFLANYPELRQLIIEEPLVKTDA